MSEANSIKNTTQSSTAAFVTANGKPAKPYPAYPLTAHPAGYWCKKIRGRIHYFGPWNDPDGALEKYLDEKHALHAGRAPRPDPGALTMKDLANEFLNAKDTAVEAGELSRLTRADYQTICDLLVKFFGKDRLVSDLDAPDFMTLKKKMAKRWGVVRMGNMIQMGRGVFRFGFETGLIERPVRFGPGFKRPSKKTLRLHRARQGVKLFTAGEIRSLIETGKQPIKTMILLGINCGFGNADCGKLPLKALDLEGGWIDFPRPKTGLPRRCPLWPETVAALKEAIADRPTPKSQDDIGLVFVTKYGKRWAKDGDDKTLSKEMGKILRDLKIERKGVNFYALRHTFRTIADQTKDSVACDSIMGHETPHMSSAYREEIGEDRLRAVVDHVRVWLFGQAKSDSDPLILKMETA
jgi:integrase